MVNGSGARRVLFSYSAIAILLIYDSCLCLDNFKSDNDLTNSVASSIVADNPSLNNKKSNQNDAQIDSESLTSSESRTISIIMQTMLPSMFGLFSNITSDKFKAEFKEPCRFDTLMDLFKQLPPYFDIIAMKYPNKPDLVAYYSMQLASTFLVNNGSLTMACLYNMLSLQTRLYMFSLDIMDNPEKNPQLVGLFGVFMKPVMSMLKKNSMMKIIDHVDRYDKNDDKNTIFIFQVLNVTFLIIGLFCILFNILLVILLRRSSITKRQIYLNQNKKLKKLEKFSSNDKKCISHSILNQKQQNDFNLIKPLYPNKSGSNEVAEKRSTNPYTNVKKEKLTELVTFSDSNGIPNIIVDESIPLSKKNGVSKSEQQNSIRPQKTDKKLRKTNKRNHTTISKYKSIKSTTILLNTFVRKRYKTRICFILIAICHSLYLLTNFMIMSQASLAAVALKGLSQLNIACKLAFFLFPPTTAYNILHQFAIWLLCYAIRQHGIKLRKTRTFNMDADADFDIDLMKSDDDTDLDGNYYETSVIDDENDEGENENDVDEHVGEVFDDQDDVSVSFTNNSKNLVAAPNSSSNVMPSQLLSNGHLNNGYHQSSVVKFKNQPEISSRCTNQSMNYHQILNHQRHPILPFQSVDRSCTHNNAGLNIGMNRPSLIQHHNRPNVYLKNKCGSSSSLSSACLCYFCSRKRKNAFVCLIMFILICAYDGQNLFLYSLSKLTLSADTSVYFCAFESSYSDYYTALSQYIVPITNLCLFSLLPLFFCTVQVLLDVCFLVRVQREQLKRYDKLKDVIEWPLYAYYIVYMISQFPFAIHQIVDLCLGTVKFPFVFPLFIQFKFSSKVWLAVFEMVLMFLAYSSDLFIWIICDRQMRRLALYWINKRILCRTYSSKNKKVRKNVSSSSSSNSSTGSSNTRNNEGGSTSSRSSSGFSGIRSESNSSTTGDMAVKTNNKLSSSFDKKKQNNVNSASNQSSINNSCASSTVSSTVDTSNNSNHYNKKQISPIIAAAADTAAATAIAAAAISASLSQPTIHDQIKQQQNSSQLSPNSIDLHQANTRIKMIDIDDVDDLDLDEPESRLAKVFEDKEIDMINLPSYNTAVRSKKMQQHQTPETFDSLHRNSHNFGHQYQNDIDLQAFLMQQQQQLNSVNRSLNNTKPEKNF